MFSSLPVRALGAGTVLLAAAALAPIPTAVAAPTWKPVVDLGVGSQGHTPKATLDDPLVTSSQRMGGDFDGDGKIDIAVWRPSTGTWYIIQSSTGNKYSVQWGQQGDVPVQADYNGDGRSDIAVWRPSEGKWFIDGGLTPVWGDPGDIPMPGDYDGDHKADLAIWRPSTGTWWIKYSGGGELVRQWGQQGDRAVTGDYDGDGKTDLVVERFYDNGTWTFSQWWIVRSSDGTGEMRSVPTWNYSSSQPVQGDYNGDGRSDPTAWSGVEWFVDYSNGSTGQEFYWGMGGDIPITGDYDGNGKSEFAIWRPSEGTWQFYDFKGSSDFIYQWGTAGDIPV